MTNIKKLVIIGFGQRGILYAGYSKEFPGKFEITAVVEPDKERREIAARDYGCPVFADADSFFSAKVQADAAVIASDDNTHLAYCLKCMSAGYDILLEKPIACSLNDCLAIEKAQKKYGCKVIVCHVLRYTPFYRRIKEVLDAGLLGDVVNIHASENVGYYHQAHSFVRGPWKVSAESTPMIVAKCCHDMDLIRWLMGKKCHEISSFGDLLYFKPRNAPLGSAAFCSDCSVSGCVYNAQEFYTRHSSSWANYFHRGEKTSEAVCAALKGTQYDRCAFKSGNDVVDNQVAIMKFEDGATACLTMTAFSKGCYRDIKIYGTKGELVGVMEQNRFELRLFGGETIEYKTDDTKVYGGHGGGDVAIMDEFYKILCGEKSNGASFLEVSLESHKMAFGAEEARLKGEIVKINKIYD